MDALRKFTRRMTQRAPVASAAVSDTALRVAPRLRATRESAAVGAVVLGGDHHGLGIVRSLGRRGIRSLVLDDESSVARFSRYSSLSARVPDVGDEGTVEALLYAASRYSVKGWVVFPTRDEQVEAISRHREALTEHFRIPHQDWTIAQWACDKRNTYRLAERLDLATPRTWYPESVEELAEIEWDGPLVLKPAARGPFLYATKAKAWRADTRAELLDRFRQASELAGPGQMMVQELIPGDGRNQFAYCTFFKKGEPLASMVARRRRQHPPQFGRATTLAETIELPAIEAMSHRFLSALGYYGLAELEYKRDPRDGVLKLLDFNARTWGYHTLGYAAGVDFPSLLFDDQMGRPIAPRRARSGVRWIRLVTDLPTGMVEMHAGHINWRAYLRSLGGIDAESIMSLRDPLPALAEFAYIPYLAVKRGF